MKKQWCIGAITSDYLARMQDVLHLYSLPYDEKRPVVCFDELPVQLLGEVVEALPMKAGKPARYDYEYERCGTAYENLPPEEALRLTQRFEMHYTPKKGSWLNMAELVFHRNDSVR